jgi:hypothetical protein
MRRKNCCEIRCDDTGIWAACTSYDGTDCSRARLLGDRHCMDAKMGCENPEARTEAATKLFKTLRRKYRVSE